MSVTVRAVTEVRTVKVCCAAQGALYYFRSYSYFSSHVLYTKSMRLYFAVVSAKDNNTDSLFCILVVTFIII